MKPGHFRPRAMRGVTLVELMVSLALGMVLTLASLNVLIANRTTADINERLSRVQESSRIAFELMARDLREAGSTGCGQHNRIVSVLNSTAWWADWPTGGLQGIESTAALPSGVTTTRTAGTDALIVSGVFGNGVTVHRQPSANAASIQLNRSNHGIASNDIVLICDNVQGTIFQVSNANASTNTIVHNTGSGTPGNCTKKLGFPRPSPCATNSGTDYVYNKNAIVHRFLSAAWYVATGSNGRPALFRRQLNLDAQEVVPDVVDLEVQYRLPDNNNYIDASAVTDWTQVTAARLALTLNDRDPADPQALQRTFTQTIALRNR